MAADTETLIARLSEMADDANGPNYTMKDRATFRKAADRIAALEASQREADARVLQAVMDERERCAKIAEQHPMRFAGQTENSVRATIAAAIRSQGGAE